MVDSPWELASTSIQQQAMAQWMWRSKHAAYGMHPIGFYHYHRDHQITKPNNAVQGILASYRYTICAFLTRHRTCLAATPNLHIENATHRKCKSITPLLQPSQPHCHPLSTSYTFTAKCRRCSLPLGTELHAQALARPPPFQSQRGSLGSLS